MLKEITFLVKLNNLKSTRLSSRVAAQRFIILAERATRSFLTQQAVFSVL